MKTADHMHGDWWCWDFHLDARQSEDHAWGDHMPCSPLLYTAFKISVSPVGNLRWFWTLVHHLPGCWPLNTATLPFPQTLVSWAEQLSLASVPVSSNYSFFNMLAFPVHDQVSSLHLLVFFWFLPSAFCNFQHIDPVHIFKCTPKYFL